MRSSRPSSCRRRALLAVLALGLSGCGADGSDPTDGGPTDRPGACLCYSGSGQLRSCLVTPDLATCRSVVTDCNPFWFTNGDCSPWCPGSPEHCP